MHICYSYPGGIPQRKRGPAPTTSRLQHLQSSSGVCKADRELRTLLWKEISWGWAWYLVCWMCIRLLSSYLHYSLLSSVSFSTKETKFIGFKRRKEEKNWNLKVSINLGRLSRTRDSLAWVFTMEENSCLELKDLIFLSLSKVFFLLFFHGRARISRHTARLQTQNSFACDQKAMRIHIAEYPHACIHCS